MKLRYIALYLDDKPFGIDFSSEFGYRTGFISNYFSKQIRKINFETDGSFNMICAELTPNVPKGCAIVPDRALNAEVPFDKERYERIRSSGDCEYYLEMLEEGFRKAAKFKKIPLEALLSLVNEFRQNGCKNEWLHKKKRFKEFDIEVALNCYFTTLDFKLIATIKRISTKEELCSGVVLRTKPDEIFFDKEFKDILMDEKRIIITDFIDHPRILIDLKEAMNKELVAELLPRNFNDEEGDHNPGIGMIKLYKNQNSVMHYYEAWDNDKEVVVHWGELGNVGENKTVAIKQGENADNVVERELSFPRSQGYKEIKIEDHKTLVIQYKTETWGDEKDLEKRHKVENLVNECLGWTGNGHCDGGQIGSGSMEVFAYVVDPYIACKSLVDELKSKGLLEGAIIAFEDDDEEFVILHPKDFQGEFKML